MTTAATERMAADVTSHNHFLLDGCCSEGRVRATPPAQTHIGCVLEALLRILDQAVVDDALQSRRKILARPVRRRADLRSGSPSSFPPRSLFGTLLSPSASRTEPRRRRRCHYARQLLERAYSRDMYPTVPNTCPGLGLTRTTRPDRFDREKFLTDFLVAKFLPLCQRGENRTYFLLSCRRSRTPTAYSRGRFAHAVCRYVLLRRYGWLPS